MRRASNVNGTGPLSQGCFVHLGAYHPFLDLAIVASKTAFDKVIKDHLKGDKTRHTYDNLAPSGASCVYYESRGLILMCFNPNKVDVHLTSVLGTIVHETTHAMQYIKEYMNNAPFGAEEEASLADWIFTHALDHLRQSPKMKQKMIGEIE